MKINKNKPLKQENPKIITDSNGKIIQINASARDELNITKDSGILGIIDVDVIRKASMFSNSIDIIKVNNEKYKEATVRVNSTGVNRTVQISFHLGYDKTEEEMAKEENMIAVVSSGITRGEYKEISCLELSNEIIEQIKLEQKCENVKIDNYSKNDVFCCNPVAVHMLSSCAICIAREVNPRKNVSFSIKKLLNFMQIEVKVKVDTLKTARTLQDVESAYPFTALKFALLDEMCEAKGVQYETYISGKSLTIRMLLDEKEPSAKLHSKAYYIDILSAIALAFTPREGIRAKYGMPEVMTEE